MQFYGGEGETRIIDTFFTTKKKETTKTIVSKMDGSRIQNMFSLFAYLSDISIVVEHDNIMFTSFFEQQHHPAVSNDCIEKTWRFIIVVVLYCRQTCTVTCTLLMKNDIDIDNDNDN